MRITTLLLIPTYFAIILNQTVRVPSHMSAQRTHLQETFVNEGIVFSGEPGRILQYPDRNQSTFTLVDSSFNGFGMISPATRPLSVIDYGWLIGYRQWNGEGGSSGQIGAAFSPDGLNWAIYTNLNPDFGSGRYPSVLGTPEYPFIFWNEYTGPQGNSLYGGKPYYAFDEFGWDGGSWSDPQIIDALWNSNKDHWVLCPDYSYDAINDEYIFNVATDDWSRDNQWIFHSEAYFDGTIIFGAETMLFESFNSQFIDEGDYTSTVIMDINNDGIGYAAVSAYFGYAKHHTIVYKKTEDFGAIWSGGQSGSDYFYIPDATFDYMTENGDFDLVWDWECLTGGQLVATQPFVTYNFDFRVDYDGNPHFLIGLIASDPDGVWTSHRANAIYHFTINKDYVNNPGDPQTPAGWNYSKVMDMSDMFKWDEPGGESYWNVVFPSLAISEENDDVMYAVIAGPVQGDAVVLGDNGTPNDDCDDFFGYPDWNEEVFVVKSEDGGQTWWCPINVTQTVQDCHFDENGDQICEDEWMCPNGTTVNRPDEISAHAGNGATNTRVNIIFQTPDWCYNSWPEEYPAYVMKNRIYSGWVELDEEDNSYCEDSQILPGDVNLDEAVDVLDIVAIVSYILSGNPLPCEPCADVNQDGLIDILDIVILVPIIIFDED